MAPCVYCAGKRKPWTTYEDIRQKKAPPTATLLRAVTNEERALLWPARSTWSKGGGFFAAMDQQKRRRDRAKGCLSRRKVQGL